jgi:hydrogenase maturation protein HypF
LKLAIGGAVQGVGFRPFIHRLATELNLRGWVNNSPQGVTIEVEGPRAALEQFLLRLEPERPPRSSLQSIESTWLAPADYTTFEIRESATGGGKSAVVLPDIATCPDCLRELLDPANRRYRYPFTNCTHCGPRFSIIEALPYDRANTAMKQFRMCPLCEAEYHDPRDRRFHAQPNACPVCGPYLELWPRAEAASASLPGRATVFEPPRPLAHDHDAILAAAHVIRCGQIVAVKGIGGYQLLVDARNEAAVQRLRERKQREEKPFALMFPTLDAAKDCCEVAPLEARLLASPEAPIVLLRKRSVGVMECSSDAGRPTPHPITPSRQYSIAPAVAPGNPLLGVMLPSNPIQHLLLRELGFPVVATSGNLSDEPICIDEAEACTRLRDLADVFLVHNRPIVRHVDDSVVRVMLDREMVLRRARGYAPLPISLHAQLSAPNAQPILGVGAHLKNSVALAVGDQVFLSQHIGDLETEAAHDAFRRAATDLPRLYDATPAIIVADLHPDYLSTRFAMERQPPAQHDFATNGGDGSESGAPCVTQVQHHIAHVWSCIAENEVALPALGVAWDGTGYGLDGTIWGGEFFRVTDESVERVAHLRPFRLPGGEAAVKEPRRSAFGLLHEMLGDGAMRRMDVAAVRSFSPLELSALGGMLARGLNSPWCSSVGRLFDAVAALIGLRQQTRFEGQAAMELEFALRGVATDEAYPTALLAGAPLRWDWSPMILAMLEDLQEAVPARMIAAKFHNALADAVVAVAAQLGETRVVLSGGCFQNRYLTERTVTRLCAAGCQPFWHQRVPPNDGGIALGQVVAARSRVETRTATALSQPDSRITHHASR